MKFYFIKTPRIIRDYFSNYTWRFNSEKKEIFLTFDDGPTPEVTNFVLDELKKYKAKATFFCIGKNIEAQQTIANRIIEENHTIGNHTQNHLNGWGNNNATYVDDFLKCDETITRFNNLTIQQKLFRPPYGKIKKSQAKEILKKGVQIIMWDVLSADFDTSINKDTCLQNVLKNTRKGSIVVFHDSVKAFEKLKFVLPRVLDEFSKKGFVFNAIK